MIFLSCPREGAKKPPAGGRAAPGGEAVNGRYTAYGYLLNGVLYATEQEALEATTDQEDATST
jgi:hypothetical protein